MSNGSRIIAPGMPTPIGVEHMNAPITNAVPFAISTPQGPQLIIAGGIHPLISLANQIAAGIASRPTSGELDPQAVAAQAVAIARAVIVECQQPSGVPDGEQLAE